MGKKKIFKMLKVSRNKEYIPLRYFSYPEKKFCFNFDSKKSGRRKFLFDSILLSNLISVHHPGTCGLIGTISEEDYKKDTSELVNLAEEVTALAKGADGREKKITSLRVGINNWVAKYRREPNFAGRPSYSNMYSVVNALSGHFNNFGTSAPIPKKRLDRIIQELDQCSLLLSKNR